MNGVQTRFKCKLDVKRCKRFVFPPSSLLPRSNALKTKAIRYFQTDRTLTRIVSPPLDENNFLHSGDLGIKDEDGNYRITGRIKDMIIRGGENIYPREIEEFLYKLDGVKDVQVAGIPSKKYGEAVGAFIILQEGVKMQEADVRDFCRNKISRYKIPKYIFFVNEFPMTGSGKIQKFRLKDLGLQLCKEQGIEII